MTLRIALMISLLIGPWMAIFLNLINAHLYMTTPNYEHIIIASTISVVVFFLALVTYLMGFKK